MENKEIKANNTPTLEQESPRLSTVRLSLLKKVGEMREFLDELEKMVQTNKLSSQEEINELVSTSFVIISCADSFERIISEL